MTLPVVLAIAGCIALLIGLSGGGISAEQVVVPKIPTLSRVLAGLIGLAFIGIAIWITFALTPIPPYVTPQSVQIIPVATSTTAPISKPTPSESPSPNSQPTLSVNGLEGTWTGSGTEVLNAIATDINGSVTLSTPCYNGPMCGSAFIPKENCSFDLTFLNLINGKYYFEPVHDAGQCGVITLTYLEPLQNGEMAFHSEGTFGIDDITLKR
jgi:hypothetical protein